MLREHSIATREPSGLQKRLVRAREMTGLNSSELSRLCGFARQYLALIESGARIEIGPSKLVAIVIVLGLSLDWLVLGRGKEPRADQVNSAVQRARLDPRAVKTAIASALGTPIARARARAKALPARRRTRGPSVAPTHPGART